MTDDKPAVHNELAMEFLSQFNIMPVDADGMDPADQLVVMDGWFGMIATGARQAAEADQQQELFERRIQAAKAAREVLKASTGFANTQPPDITDVIALAGWLMTGEDPWPLTDDIYTEQHGRDHPIRVIPHARRIVDVPLPDDDPPHDEASER